MTKTITSENFEETVSAGVSVIDFWAEWCGPCRVVGPIIESISDEVGGKATVGKCNVDEVADLSMKFGIRSIPTVLFFKDGELVDKVVGATSKEGYMAILNKYVEN